MKRKFCSLDRSYKCVSDVDEPSIPEQIMNLNKKSGLIAQGAGISYVPASFGQNIEVVTMSKFDRILEFQPEKNEVHVEGGITLGQLYSFLSPKGFSLPVQPGHPQITVGGCIALNVHGKNQFREGLFCNHVNEIRLFHPDHGIMDLSRTKQALLFELTCGGLGLTGLILSATLGVVPIKGFQVQVEHIPVLNLLETIHVMFEHDQSSDLLYTWNDFSSYEENLGRGFVVRGSILETKVTEEEKITYKRIDPHRNKIRPKVLGPNTFRFINRIYLNRMLKNKTHRMSFYHFCYPTVGKEFYYDLYGNKGFIEQQFLVPRSEVHEYIKELVFLIRKVKPSITLASCKIFRGQQKLLNYSGSGVSISLDMPRRTTSINFLNLLDQLNIEAGVIANIGKDSRLSNETVRKQYIQYDEFRNQLQTFDPLNRFKSALSQRLSLTP